MMHGDVREPTDDGVEISRSSFEQTTRFLNLSRHDRAHGLPNLHERPCRDEWQPRTRVREHVHTITSDHEQRRRRAPRRGDETRAMSSGGEDVMEFDLSMAVCASDGPVGRVRDLVVDPIKTQLTHLVVETYRGRAHLIPFGAIYPEATVGRSEIVLLWTSADVDTGPSAAGEDFVAVAPDYLCRYGVGPHVAVRAWPLFPGGESIAAPSYSFCVGRGRSEDVGPTTVTTRIEGLPWGMMEISRRSDVITSDDQLVGHVDGLVVDPGRGVTHLVLEKGHNWHGRDVALPIGEVRSATRDHVHLACVRAAIEHVPVVPFHRHDRGLRRDRNR